MFVTNCLSFLDQVDEIFVMENGCLVKQGSFSSIDLNEFFKKHETSFVKDDTENQQSKLYDIY